MATLTAFFHPPVERIRRWLHREPEHLSDRPNAGPPHPRGGGSADCRPTGGRVNRRRRGYASGVRRKTNPDHDAGARPDYHDPTASFGGAAPARSALTLRLVLASFGLILCGIAAVAALTVAEQPVFALFLAVLAAAAAVDIAVISGRKRRGEPG